MTTTIKYLCSIIMITFSIFIDSQIASADNFKIDDLEIMHPHAKAPLSNARVTGGYLSIKNTGSSDDKLIAVKVDFAAKAELHEMTMKGEVMKMRPLQGGIKIAAGQTLTLATGGNHIMFIGLKFELIEGDKQKGILVFEKAGDVEVQFEFESFSKIRKRARMVRMNKTEKESMGHDAMKLSEHPDHKEHGQEMYEDTHDLEKHNDDNHHVIK